MEDDVFTKYVQQNHLKAKQDDEVIAMVQENHAKAKPVTYVKSIKVYNSAKILKKVGSIALSTVLVTTLASGFVVAFIKTDMKEQAIREQQIQEEYNINRYGSDEKGSYYYDEKGNKVYFAYNDSDLRHDDTKIENYDSIEESTKVL